MVDRTFGDVRLEWRRDRPRPAVRSRKADPDLFLMALLARFRGYFPGYSCEIAEHHDYLTWAILKAHTANRAGTVTLRSADPQDTPLVEFNFFDPERRSERR